MESIKQRAHTVANCICAIFKLTPDQYINLWYELGFEYGEANIMANFPAGNIKNNVVRRCLVSHTYWNWWAEEWLEHCEVFIEWNYPKKNITHLKALIKQTTLSPQIAHKIIKYSKYQQAV